MNLNYNTENYSIMVGDSLLHENEVAYQIVNTDTGVIEFEDNILPRTIDALLNLQNKLTEANSQFSPQLRSVDAKGIH